MNRFQSISVLLLGFLFVTNVFAGDKKEEVRYELQVFRLNGSFESRTKLDHEIWKGTAEEWERIKDEVTLFDSASFRIGNDRLEIGRRGCHWNETRLTFEEGHKVKLPEHRIKMILSPNILKRTGETVHMKIESKQPFEFMKPKGDGLFEKDEVALPVGLDIKVKARRERKDVFLLSDLDLELRTVNRREDVKGTKLNIGKPILEEYEYELKIEVREGKNYGVLLRPKGAQGAIIIRLDIDDE